MNNYKSIILGAIFALIFVSPRVFSICGCTYLCYSGAFCGGTMFHTEDVDLPGDSQAACDMHLTSCDPGPIPIPTGCTGYSSVTVISCAYSR